MKSDYDIVAEAHGNIQDNLLVTAWWRANEIRDNFGIYEGSQWLQEDYQRQLANNMPTRTINRTQTILDAITGFQIQNRSDIKCVPRLLSGQEQGYTDLANDGIRWIEDTSNYRYQTSLAMRDMLICGLGFVDYNIEYDKNPNGEAYAERIFPYFMMWDVTTRNQNLGSANWLCRAHIIDRNKLHQWLVGLNKDQKEEADAEFGAAVDARFLDFFDTVMIVKSLGVIYQYQWRDKVPFYRIENPLQGFEGDPNDPHTQQVVELAKVMQEKYKCNPYMDKIVPIPSGDNATMKEAFRTLGFENVKSVMQKQWKYYRADIVGNQVIRKSENFTQKSFSMKCMTGKYDEIRQCYYGMVRSMKEPQRLMNQAVSDYEGFLKTIPKGGVEIESDAVPNLEGFLDTYTKAAQVTIYSPGALMANKVRPKIAPPVPDGLLQMIDFANRSLMEVIGVTPDFMGMTDSKLMTAQLNAQLVRQGLMVLAPYFDALEQYTVETGHVMIDILRVLVDNSEGRLIKHITPEGSAQYVPLLMDNLTDEYDVTIEKTPHTPDERQTIFEKLLQLAGILANKPNPVDIMPLVMEYAPFDGENLGKIKQMMAPPPPQGPDPMMEALTQAEVLFKQASAAKQEAEALRAQADAMLKQKELEHADVDAFMAAKKANAQADYDQVRSAREMANLSMDAERMYKEMAIQQ
jgi:hypothetical protein